MPRYSYIAKSLKGEPRSGVLEAKDERELARSLRQEGDILIKAELEKEKPLIKRDLSEIFTRFKKISLREKIFFTRNLRIMIGAGLSLPRAIRTLSEQTKIKKFQDILLKIEKEITKGQNLSDALSRHPQVFSELFVSMIKVGEESGTLEEVLKNLTNQMEREEDLKSKVKGAMIYPAVILTVMVLIGVLMMVMVVPKLAAIFEELKVELPFTTKIIISFGQNFTKIWPIFILIFILLPILFNLIFKNKKTKRIIDMIFLKLPLIAPLNKKINTALTSRTLGSLIASGVPIVRSLEIVGNTLGNSYFKEAIEKASEDVQKGSKLSQSLKNYEGLYPSIMIQMIAVGEETGETAEILGKLADFYEEEVTNITKNLSSIIEPLLMVVIGAAVGFFAISMIQPMYSMMGAI
jgi:type IV pilus assembly protein PilC